MMRTEMKSSFIVSDRSTKTANTEPFPRRQKAILRNNNKKPQFHLLDGTIWHGPTFKKLAKPIDADKTEIENVIQYMMY